MERHDSSYNPHAYRRNLNVDTIECFVLGMKIPSTFAKNTIKQGERQKIKSKKEKFWFNCFS